MANERVIHPPIKKSFDAIGHVALTDQIGSSMERFQDEDGSLYDHSSFMGTEAMRGIARYCEDVHMTETEYENVWVKARKSAISDVSFYSRLYQENVATNPPSDSVTEHEQSRHRRRENLYNGARSALLMYAIERHDHTTTASQRDDIDKLFLSREWPVIDVLAELQDELEKSGLVVCNEDSTIVTSVADIIKGRQGEIEQFRYQDALSSIEATTESDKGLSWSHMALRYAEHISTEQYDVLLSKVLSNPNDDIEMKLHLLSEVLEALPREYLRALHDRDDDIAMQFRDLVNQITGTNYTPPSLRPFHNYFPGGLTGDAAKSHSVIGPMLQSMRSDSMVLCEALPLDRELSESTKEWTPHEIDSFNREVRQVIRETCVSIFGEQGGTRYAKDVIRSFEPRKFISEQVPVYEAYGVQKNLLRIESFAKKWGAETIMQLHDKFDMAAVDIISHGDIKKLKGLMEGDPEVVDKLKEQDLTLIAFDAYGSHNEAMYNIVTMLNTTSSHRSRIVIPWKKSSDIYRMLALLKNRDIKFTTLAVATHGNPGTFSVNKGDESLTIISDDLPIGRTFSSIDILRSEQVSLSNTSLRRITRDYMKLPEYADEMNLPTKKRIIFCTCFGDVGIDGVIPSIAEATLTTISDTDTIVVGGENLTATNKAWNNSKELNLFGPPRDEAWDDRKANTYKSNLVTLTSDPVTWTTVRTPHPGGVIA